MCINYDGNTFTEYIPPCASKKSCDFARWDGITWLTSGLILFTASICCYGHSEKPEQSLSSKYFCINVLHDCVPRDHILCLVCSLWGASNLCHIWKLLYSVASLIFLVIFSATVYQEVTILFSDSLDGNGALFAYVLCDIPVLHISLIWIFGWKHSYYFN